MNVFCLTFVAMFALLDANAIVRENRATPEGCAEIELPAGCIGCSCVLTPSTDSRGCPSYTIICESSEVTKVVLDVPEPGSAARHHIPSPQGNRVVAADSDLEWIKQKLLQIEASIAELKIDFYSNNLVSNVDAKA